MQALGRPRNARSPRWLSICSSRRDRYVVLLIDIARHRPEICRVELKILSLEAVCANHYARSDNILPSLATYGRQVNHMQMVNEFNAGLRRRNIVDKPTTKFGQALENSWMLDCYRHRVC